MSDLIDLHSHLLPGIDDGSQNLETSLEMARMAVADGISIMACTPHIYPGLYENQAAGIEAGVKQLQGHLEQAGIPLRLVVGADTHLVPGLLTQIRQGLVPTINHSRYLLLEPSHHVAPPRFKEAVFELVAAGYTPVITHPERLSYVDMHYDTFAEMTRQGAWMQITAGALTGRFGARVKYWAEKFVGEGLTHIIATDAHTVRNRAPRLAEGMLAAERIVGSEEARRMVHERPLTILNDVPPSQTQPLWVPTRPPAKGIWGNVKGWLGN